jgi:hypothetical protein
VTNNIISWLLFETSTIIRNERYESTSIKANSNLSNFYVKSSDLPGIVFYYVEGTGQEPNGHAPWMAQGLLYGGVKGKTLGPVKLPWEINSDLSADKTAAILNRLTGYMDESYNLGWIEEAKIRDYLKQKLSEIKAFSTLGDKAHASAALSEILAYNEKYKDKDKVILTETYGILKYNLEYVRDNLLAETVQKVQAPGGVFTLTGDNVNLRADAGTNSDVLAVLKIGAKVTLLGRLSGQETIGGKSGYWAYIDTGMKDIAGGTVKGWVFDAYLKAE